MTDTGGNSLGTMKYYPYGSTRSGSVPTDELFTGQKLDGTGLYYYGARYYDPSIGRFISADTIIPNPSDPQSFNRYSYCLNNPLKYIDPSGHNLYTSQGTDVQDIDRLMNEPEMYLMVTGSADMVANFAEEAQGEDYQFVQEMRILEEKGELAGDPTISDYILDEDDYIVQSTENKGFEINELNTRNNSEASFWSKYGQLFIGAGEIIVGVPTAIFFGACTVAFAEVPFTLPFTIGMTYTSVQLAIDGWNRMTEGQYFIDGNALPYP